jgi:hypothetical protein
MTLGSLGIFFFPIHDNKTKNKTKKSVAPIGCCYIPDPWVLVGASWPQFSAWRVLDIVNTIRFQLNGDF